jgi:hypothetical protein
VAKAREIEISEETMQAMRRGVGEVCGLFTDPDNIADTLVGTDIGLALIEIFIQDQGTMKSAPAFLSAFAEAVRTNYASLLESATREDGTSMSRHEKFWLIHDTWITDTWPQAQPAEMPANSI